MPELISSDRQSVYSVHLLRSCFWGDGYPPSPDMFGSSLSSFSSLSAHPRPLCLSRAVHPSNRLPVHYFTSLPTVSAHHPDVHDERSRVVPFVRGRPPLLELAVRAHPTAPGAHLRRVSGQNADLPRPTHLPRGGHHARTAGQQGEIRERWVVLVCWGAVVGRNSERRDFFCGV